MAKLFANSGDPDQTPHFVASELGLHCLPITLVQISPLQWVKGKNLLPLFSEGKQKREEHTREIELPGKSHIAIITDYNIPPMGK